MTDDDLMGELIGALLKLEESGGEDVSEAEMAQGQLHGLMLHLSEKHYRAGWLTGCEFDLWKAAQCTSKEGFDWGLEPIPLWTCGRLKELADEAGGWWVHVDTYRRHFGETTETHLIFLPSDDWTQVLGGEVHI